MSGFLHCAEADLQAVAAGDGPEPIQNLRRACVGSASTLLLPAWIARRSLLANESSSVRSMAASAIWRFSDPITAGRKNKTLAAAMRTPVCANAAQSASNESSASLRPGKIGSIRASIATCWAINSAAWASRSWGEAA